jgi:GNAT superfamily N-acetyltransferase
MRVTYRKFGRDDLAAAHRLSLEAGWPHRLEDWAFVYGLGTGHVAEEGGEVVGTVLGWKHDRRNASLGMVIVAKDRQGRGIGRKLMALELSDLEGRAILLNATRAGRPLYEALGFKAIDEVEQHQGPTARVPVALLPRGERLRPVGASDGPKLVALAARASGSSQRRAITRLLDVAEGIVLARGAEPIGFALLRRFGRGRAIGPVVAPDSKGATALIGHWAAMNPGKFLRIDVPASAALGEWLDGIGMKKVDTVVTMVKGAPPGRDARMRSFAIISQALG